MPVIHIVVGPCALGATSVAEQRVTLEVHRAERVAVLRALAEMMRIDPVVGDDVTGTVTLSLRNVTVREAFDGVLHERSFLRRVSLA